MEDILMEIIESAKVEALDELEKEAKCGMDELVESLSDEEAEFDFDKYCEDNPDFNAALNGHPDFI